jgi:Glycosyltransferase WbsX
MSVSRRELLALAPAVLAKAGGAPGYQVGAYYFPGYHPDRRVTAAHGPGWTEWELVKRAEPRFAGHQQPKRPLWGYEDESAPEVFARKIDAAADHGLSHFLFDWYWYSGEPFLHRCLENGYLKAPNKRRLKFALMWANHDWLDIQPAKRSSPPALLHAGAVTPAVFDKMTDYVTATYFTDPSYWKIAGAPYFSIYELYRFIDGIGGIESAQTALARFREKTKAAGLPDLHLNAVTWGVKTADLARLGFNSVTSYVWIHHVRLPECPVTPYAYATAEAPKYWHRADTAYGLPFHPNVTMGWDSSPRACQSDVFADTGYPFMPTLGGNTPQAFRGALKQARQFLDSRPSEPRILNINAWNEWTEGSYLEPDTTHGFEYLRAIRDVFGQER